MLLSEFKVHQLIYDRVHKFCYIPISVDTTNSSETAYVVTACRIADNRAVIFNITNLSLRNDTVIAELVVI